METILLALAPVIVNGIASGVKKLRTKDWIKKHKGLFRSLLAVGAVVLMLLKAVFLGDEVDVNALQVAVESALVWFASQGTYFLSKQKR